MTEDRLADFLSQADPPLGPALTPDSVLRAARRRQRRRQSFAASGVVGVATVGSFALIQLDQQNPNTISRPGVLVEPTTTAPFSPPPVQVPTVDPSTAPSLAPVDPGGPAASSCDPQSAAVATVELNPDTPSPRCTTLHAGQSLRIMNSTNAFGSAGSAVTLHLAGYAAETLAPGKSFTYVSPSDRDAPGYHEMMTSLYGGQAYAVELLVEG